MIQYNKKTIIIASVLLFCSLALLTGSAAASVATSDRTVSDTTINPGDTVDITIDIQTNQTGGDVLINESFSGPISSATGSVVEKANGTAIGPIDEEGSSVLIRDADANSNITLVYNITANSSIGTIDIIEGSDSNTSMGSTSIDVTRPVAPAPPAPSVAAADRTLSTNSITTSETVNVTVELQTNQNGNNVTFNDTFTGPIKSVSGETVDNANASSSSILVSSDRIQYDYTNPDPNSNITLNYTFEARTTGLINISDGANSDASLGTTSVDVTSSGGNNNPPNSGNTSLSIGEVDGTAGGAQNPQPVTAILDISSGGQPYSGVVSETKLDIEVGSESVTSGITVDKRKPGTWAIIFFAPTQSSAGTYDLNVSFDDTVLGNSDSASSPDAITYSSTDQVQASIVQQIDESGSMGFSGTPLKIVQAKAGAKQVIASSSSNDYLSIVGYDSTATIEQNLSIKSGNVTKLENAVDRLDDGGGTDIAAATREGLKPFDKAPSGTSKAAILLTDGRDSASESEVINNIVPKYNKRNVCLYTVGFGSGADETFLKRIANTSDCGTYSFAAEQGSSTAGAENTLDQVLTDIKGTVSGEEQLDSDSGNVTAGDTISKSYNIDDSVNVKSVTIDVGQIPANNISLSDVGRTTIQSASESSLVSTTQSGSGTVKLIDPSGNVVASDANQDVEINVIDGQVTYRIQDPQSGQWEYEIVNQGSDELSYQTEVAGDAQASLDVSTPANTYYETGSASVTGLFYGQNGDIENAVVTANVTQPDGTTKTVSFTEINPGVYTANIDLPDDGSYSITTNAKKNNIIRQNTKTITAKSLSKSPVSVSTQSSGAIDADTSGTADVDVGIEPGGVGQQLDVGISELDQVGGDDTIRTSQISIGTQRISVAAGGSQTVSASVDVPAYAADGTYNGTVSVYRPDGSVVTDTVSVAVNNPQVSVPGGTAIREGYVNTSGSTNTVERSSITQAVVDFNSGDLSNRGVITKLVVGFANS